LLAIVLRSARRVSISPSQAPGARAKSSGATG
jgi:hypothetical protein